MFLNLKNKKVIDVINQQTSKISNHPKTHRDQPHQHSSKEQKEIKSFRQYQNYNSKKIVGSTAVSTIQQNNSSFSISNNPNYAVRKHEEIGRSSMQSQNKSQQKLDSHRMQRVASAYKKIKKYDNNQSNYLVNDGEKSHERLKKLVNKGNKIIVKKQLLHNIANNYICATQGDDNQAKIYEKLSSYKVDNLSQIIEPIIQVFSNETSSPYSRTKSKSHSSRDNQFNNSLQKNSKNQNKEKRKKSNQILIKDTQNPSLSEDVSLHSYINHFNKRLERGREKLQALTQSKKYKYLQSSSNDLIQVLFQEIESFVFQIYGICLKEMDFNLFAIEERMKFVLQQQLSLRQQFKQIQEKLILQQQKSTILEDMVLNYQQKTLYSTIFFNQLSFNSDIDSFFREKLHTQAKRNGLVSEFSESQVDQGKAQVLNNHSQALKTKERNQQQLQDNNQNEFISFKIPFFNKCLDQNTMKRKK